MSKIEIQKCPVTDWEQNCRLIVDAEKKQAIIVDPGGDAPKIIAVLEQQNLQPTAIWLTHSHLDHCGGVADLKEHYNIPLLAHAGEKEFRGRIEQMLVMYGLPAGAMRNCPEPEQLIDEGDVLNFGGEDFLVLFVPGHSPGHVAFYNAANKVLLCGDTVFKQSIGRTDLPGGNHQQLLSSIRNKIVVLPPDTKLLPGHGDDTTLEFEIKYNPFLS